MSPLLGWPQADWAALQAKRVAEATKLAAETPPPTELDLEAARVAKAWALEEAERIKQETAAKARDTQREKCSWCNSGSTPDPYCDCTSTGCSHEHCPAAQGVWGYRRPMVPVFTKTDEV